MTENVLLKPKCSWNVADSNEILDYNMTVTSPQGNLATGNLSTDLVTSPQKAEKKLNLATALVTLPHGAK